MVAYLLRRLFLIIPTLFGILLINFIIIQAAPGGPVEQTLAKIRGTAQGAQGFLGGGHDGFSGHDFTDDAAVYQGSQGLDPAFVRKIEAMYGFDQPAPQRFWRMIKNYLTFDLGESYFKSQSVMDLIKDKLPVSISLGLWSTLIIYLISIPLGIRKAVRDGSPFDVWTSSALILGYAVPSFLFAIFLVVLFAGGSYFTLFPLRGLVSDHWDTLSLGGKILDYAWHMVLPITAMVVGGFASLTFLTKNAFMEEINKLYVLTARSKGLSEKGVLYGHVFRNAMLIVIASLPSALIHIFLTGSLLIEVIFSLDGLGLLGFESALQRDYPVVFGTLYLFTLLGLVVHIMGDLTYTLVDPRIDFDKRSH